MNATSAKCGHSVVAVGAPGSQARNECEGNVCSACQGARVSQSLEMCDRLKVKTGFTIKDPSTGRKRAFKAGREYWVTTGSYRHGEVVGIAPKGKNMGYAMLFSPTIVDEYFEKME